MAARAVYVCLQRKEGRPVRFFMGDGLSFHADDVEVRADEAADVSLEKRGEDWYYTASGPCVIVVGGKEVRVEASDTPRKW